MKHQINLEDVKAVLDKAEVLIAASSRTKDDYRKHLYFVPSKNSYKVVYKNETVYETFWVDWAIEEYNKY